MKKLLYLGLSDIIVYKKPTKFVFKKGITFVKGRNLHRNKIEASNGSGKTTLFKPLPNIIFDSDPLITKNARTIHKQAFVSTQSSMSIGLEVNKKRYEFIKTKKGLSVSINGKEQNSRLPKDILASVVDCTETEFYSTVYIDSRRPNHLQMGTSAERIMFLTNLFRLNNLDDFKLYISRTLSSIKTRLSANQGGSCGVAFRT